MIPNPKKPPPRQSSPAGALFLSAFCFLSDPWVFLSDLFEKRSDTPKTFTKMFYKENRGARAPVLCFLQYGKFGCASSLHLLPQAFWYHHPKRSRGFLGAGSRALDRFLQGRPSVVRSTRSFLGAGAPCLLLFKKLPTKTPQRSDKWFKQKRPTSVLRSGDGCDGIKRREWSPQRAYWEA